MTKQKQNYKVFVKNFDSWKFIGETFAVSPRQAINNMRYRRYGAKSSQYSYNSETYRAVNEFGEVLTI